MTFTKRLKNLIAKVPTMTNAELVAANNDLAKASVVLYMGAPDRVLNLCNEALDDIAKEMKRRVDETPGEGGRVAIRQTRTRECGVRRRWRND